MKKAPVAVVLILALCILAVPVHLYSADEKVSVYTIQVGSHSDVDAANSQFDSIVSSLSPDKLSFLRIEAVGRFFPVRMGKFDNKAGADALLEEIRAEFPTAIVMDAYFIEKRIKRMFEAPVTQLTDDEQAEPVRESKDMPPPVPQPEPPVKEAEPEKEMPAQERIALLSGLIQNRDYDRALDVAHKGVELLPDNHELNAWYGTALLKSNRPEEALTYFRKAAALSPSAADYHNGTGYCLFYLDRYEEALNAFNKALSIDGKHVDALAGQGIVHVKRGNKSQALAVQRKLEDIDSATAAKIRKMIDDAKMQ
jgi:tetratricopeptide (TPR) repeat protein